jgi:hypothetical protein
VKMGKFWTALMVPLLWRYLDFLCFYFLIKLDGAFCFFFFFFGYTIFLLFLSQMTCFHKRSKACVLQLLAMFVVQKLSSTRYGHKFSKYSLRVWCLRVTIFMCVCMCMY